MGAVLSLRRLRHRRGGREVLRIDELRLGAGERLAVLGPNGAGKTTLLRLLAGLEAPTEGEVEIDGEPVTASGAGARRRIGYATQRPGLLSTSVRRNVELPLRWRGVPRAQRGPAALRALGRVGAAHLAERRALSLSGGEAQRVNLARALALAPSVLLLDEPAAGLDPEARERFLDDLADALAGGTTTVVHVSHRPEEALRLADRVAILSDGHVRQLGAPADIVRRPADATTAKLLGYHNVVPVEVGPDGRLLLADRDCGLRSELAAAPATLAAWATAVALEPPGETLPSGTVERVSPGQGRWELTVACGGETLRAHLPIDPEPPAPGERVGVRIDPSGATVIAYA